MPTVANSSTVSRPFHAARRKRRMSRAALLLAGLLLPQLVLLWTSLFGSTVMLPLDILTHQSPGLYSATDGPLPSEAPRNVNHIDMLMQFEPFRRYAVDELHAGRLPLWIPHASTGTSFIGIGQTAIFSPYRAIEFLSPDPRVLAWGQLAKAIVAGLGMFFFLRVGLRLRFTVAASGAWIYPLTGFLTLWAGYPMMAGISWMPWALLATELSFRRRDLRWPALIGVFICFCVFAGHLQVVGHTLLLSGLYAVFSVGRMLVANVSKRSAAAAMARCVLGWTLGFALASIQFFPMTEYILGSLRWQSRQSGSVERPAIGFASAPQVFNPWLGGDRRSDTTYLFRGNRLEGSAAAYPGLLVVFVAAPFAWRRRRRRAEATFWLATSVLGVAQVLGIPLLQQICEAPPLGVLSSNRMTIPSPCSIGMMETRTSMSRPATVSLMRPS